MNQTQIRQTSKTEGGETMKTVGRFTWDGNHVTGPAEYMKAPRGFTEIKQRLESGNSMVVKAAPIGADPITTMLVAIQTHYAGWKGAQELLRMSS